MIKRYADMPQDMAETKSIDDFMKTHPETQKFCEFMALKEAKNKCKAVLLEPIMKVDVVVPDEYFGNVMGDLTSRRGRPLGQESVGNAIKLSAMVPLAEMFGYATDLRSKTQGRGQYSMEPSHFAEVPKSIQETIIKERGKNAAN